MAIPAESAKQHLITILQQQPEDSSYDELLKELAFARMIHRGLNDAEAGRVVGDEELRGEIESWQTQK